MNFTYSENAKIVKGNLESWFLNQSLQSFPNHQDYVAYYKTLKDKLKPIHKQVTMGADHTDGTTLTWHDSSHIETVIEQASALLSYSGVSITPFEAFILLVSIQIHDIMNSDGRQDHELRATEIFEKIALQGIIDSVTIRTISKIVNCHSGTFERSDVKEKDKIGYLMKPSYALKGVRIRIQFLAAILRLADEYADNENRAMAYLFNLGKIQKASEVHHKYAECLHSVIIEPDTGIVKFDFHVEVSDVLRVFEKQINEDQGSKEVFLIDEIFSRLLKSFYETVYCMRFLRPEINITKLSIHIEIELRSNSHELSVDFELVEKGYPTTVSTILQLCESSLQLNGGHWSGENLKKYIIENHLS